LGHHCDGHSDHLDHPASRRIQDRPWLGYTREDEIAAESFGINTVRMKLLAFALGAAIADVAGASSPPR
jgi:hypothetical protein